MTYTGAPNSLLNLAVLLRSKGHTISVFTQQSGEFIKEFHKHLIRVKYCDPDSFNYDILNDYDLAIANTIFCGKFALKAQKYIPTILYIREAENLPEIIHSCGLKDDYLNKIKIALCVSEYAEKYISSTYNISNLAVIHNFLSPPVLHMPPTNICKDGVVHFLIAGTIEKRKGIDIAIHAIDLLSDGIKDKFMLHIVGRKPEWAHEYWMNLKMDNNDKICYHGEIKSRQGMYSLYKRINCVIVPSLDESCSLTALEGAMFGRALILSENVGAKYLINESGLVFQTASAESLSSAITQLIKNSKLLPEMGRNSYKMYKKTSTPAVYYKKISSLLCDMLKQKH